MLGTGKTIAKKYKIAAVATAILAIVLGAWLYLRHTGVAVFTPAGPIANQERQLIFIALGLSLFVVIPVFVMAFTIAWKYRASNETARYEPDWDHSRKYETIWWLVPSILIAILSVITWRASHELDPYRALSSPVKPLTIQVVALDWKWLFIYPNERVASVNQVKFPVGTPVNFQITADAPMNSFWIPRLGGQVYAMPGMSTQLHLLATQPGSYRGSSSNISGSGFSTMHFAAEAVSQADFNNWLQVAKLSHLKLNFPSYNKLAAASTSNPITYYADTEPSLYDVIVMKFMEPLAGSNSVADASIAPDLAGVGTR